MANEKKNISKLVTDHDTDRMSEFQTKKSIKKSGRGFAPEIEVDAPTFDIDELHPRTKGRTRNELEVQLRAQSVHIEELNFDIEQMLNRQRGLESELAAREEILASISRDVENTDTRDPEETAHSTISADRDLFNMRAELLNTRAEFADLRNYIDSRKYAWDELNIELNEVRKKLESRNLELSRISKEADESSAQLVKTREQYAVTSKQLSQHKDQVDSLRKTVRDLERSLHHEAQAEILSSRARLSEQSGELAALRQELKTLQRDNARMEQYADSLRMQLHDQTAIANSSTAAEGRLKAGLEVASETIGKLSRALDDEKLANIDHVSAIEKLNQEFEREVRQIRFELGAAEETIAGQEVLNDQLVSNLIDHQGYRRALETELSEVEAENEKTIQTLTIELKRARHENEDYDRKLGIKDSAIADLMRELSNHTGSIELRGEFENVLQKIDGFRSETDQDTDRTNRGRVARLLIGNADGRVLRFPLFKDRLTIGRTSHNDIQLNVQYISRRHAVIATYNGDTRIIDWGSKNGVFVNRKRVTEQLLQSGDVVSFGIADFKYEERNKR